jgi:hypothetical protein
MMIPAIAPPLIPDEDLLVEVAAAEERMLLVDELVVVVENREEDWDVEVTVVLVLVRTDEEVLASVEEVRVDVVVRPVVSKGQSNQHAVCLSYPSFDLLEELVVLVRVV